MNLLKTNDLKLNRTELYKYILVPSVILFAVFSVLLLQVISDLRLLEVNQRLQEYKKKEGVSSSLGLVARFQMLQARMQKGYESDGDYLKEGRLFAILSDEYSNRKETRYTFLHEPARLILDGLAFMSGREPLQLVDEEEQRMLELAYFFERRRKYEQAITLYSQALAWADDSNDQQYIYLHRGFNLALNGEKKKGSADLKEAISIDKNTSQAETARRLLGFIKNADARMRQLEALPLSLQKGVAYFNLMNFRRAIELFNLLPASADSQAKYFYRGRSYEELGNINQAIADYRETIVMNPATEIARQANRRIYMLGAYYTQNDRLKKQAITTGRELGDAGFIIKSEKIVKNLNKDKESQLIESEKSKALLSQLEETTKTDFDEALDPLKETDVDKKIAVAAVKKETTPPRTTTTVKVEKKPEITKPVNPPQVEKVVTEPSQVEFDLDVYLRPNTSRDIRKKMLRNKYQTLDKISTRTGSEFLGVIVKTYSDSYDILTLRGLYNIKKVDILTQSKTNINQLK